MLSTGFSVTGMKVVSSASEAGPVARASAPTQLGQSPPTFSSIIRAPHFGQVRVEDINVSINLRPSKRPRHSAQVYSIDIFTGGRPSAPGHRVFSAKPPFAQVCPRPGKDSPRGRRPGGAHGGTSRWLGRRTGRNQKAAG